MHNYKNYAELTQLEYDTLSDSDKMRFTATTRDGTIVYKLKFEHTGKNTVGSQKGGRRSTKGRKSRTYKKRTTRRR